MPAEECEGDILINRWCRNLAFSVLPLRLFGLCGDGFLRSVLTTEAQSAQRSHRVSQVRTLPINRSSCQNPTVGKGAKRRTSNLDE